MNPSRAKFRIGPTNLLQGAWRYLRWPSPGRGEADDPSRGLPMFRSYRTGTENGPYPDPLMSRPDVDSDLESVPVTIPFVLVANPPARRMAVSPLILGPAIIENIELELNVQVGASNAVFSLF